MALALVLWILAIYQAEAGSGRVWWMLGSLALASIAFAVYSSVPLAGPAPVTGSMHALRTALRAFVWVAAAFVFAAVQYNVQYELDRAPFQHQSAVAVWKDLYDFALPVVGVALWAELTLATWPIRRGANPVAVRRIQNLAPKWRASAPGPERLADEAHAKLAPFVVTVWLMPAGVALAVSATGVCVDSAVRLFVSR